MALMQAARLCPQAVLLPADFDEYRRYSRLFKAAITAIAPRIEDRGIDEVYIDFHRRAGRPRERQGLPLRAGASSSRCASAPGSAARSA